MVHWKKSHLSIIIGLYVCFCHWKMDFNRDAPLTCVLQFQNRLKNIFYFRSGWKINFNRDALLKCKFQWLACCWNSDFNGERCFSWSPQALPPRLPCLAPPCLRPQTPPRSSPPLAAQAPPLASEARRNCWLDAWIAAFHNSLISGRRQVRAQNLPSRAIVAPSL